MKNNPYQKLIDGNGTTIMYMPTTMMVPEDPENTDYQNFLTYLDENELTINDIADYEP